MTADEILAIARRFEADYAAAFDRRDPSGLAALFIQDATLVTEWGDVVQGRDAFARGLERAFEKISAALTLDNVPTYATLVSDGVIVSHGASHRRDRSTGADDRLSFTRVLVLRDGTWLLAANHVSEPSRRPDPRGG